MFNQPISTSSLESEALPSQHAGQASEQSASPRSTHALPALSPHAGRQSPILETCDPCVESPVTWLQEDFLASHLASPASNEGREITVISGRKCSALSNNHGPLGCLEKMLLESSAWRSTECSLIWKPSATPAGRLLFQLVPSMLRTHETGFGLLPTPQCMDAKGYSEALRHKFRKTGHLKHWTHGTALAVHSRTGRSSWPNPMFSEWLMGFPQLWMSGRDYTPTETPSSRKSLTKSSKPSVECYDGKTVPNAVKRSNASGVSSLNPSAPPSEEQQTQTDL